MNSIRPNPALSMLKQGVHTLIETFTDATHADAHKVIVTATKAEHPKIAANYMVGNMMKNAGTDEAEMKYKTFDRVQSKLVRKHFVVTENKSGNGFRAIKRVRIGDRRFKIRATYNARNGALRISATA